MAPKRRPQRAASGGKIALALVCVLFLAARVYLTFLSKPSAGKAEQEQAAAAAIDESTPAGVVEAFISKHRIAVFSKSYCPYSKRGKALMRQYAGAQVAVMELDQREDGGALQTELQAITGARTVPRIFVDKVCLGGADDVSAMDAEGKLQALLQEKGLVRATQ